MNTNANSLLVAAALATPTLLLASPSQAADAPAAPTNSPASPPAPEPAAPTTSPAPAPAPEPAPSSAAPAPISITQTDGTAAPLPSVTLGTTTPGERPRWKWGAHAELDLGTLFFLRQGAAFAGGVVHGPFRAGMSYATFLSNSTFGGTPDGFTMRVNHIIGFNLAYFIAQKEDKGFYVQGMFHIKQQGVTNDANGAHEDLNSLAAGIEVGYVWKIYQGLYIAPRVGALYYVKKPQGPDNKPVDVGGKLYDNSRHKTFDTYLIPTLSVGYSW